MADVFARALAFVLEREGGYVNNPKDPGGETSFGISRRAYPEEDIKGMTRERAAELYRRDYFDPLGLADMPDVVAAAVFDAAVNCGAGRAGQLLQRAINAQCAEPPLAVDGTVGPMTKAAVRQLGLMGMSHQLVEALLFERLEHYAGLCADANKRTFLLGWLRRVLALRELCGELKG